MTTDSAVGTPIEQISEALRRQVEAFKNKLIDFSRNNRLLFYRDLKVGTLRLPPTNSASIQRLLAGDICKLADLWGTAGDITDRAKVREIRLRAKTNEEERGLKTLFIALGFAAWSLDDGGRDPMAPLFLLPVDVAEANRPGIDPTIQRAGDLQPNYSLISYVQDHYRITLDVDQLVDEEAEDIALSISTFERMLSELPKLRIDLSCVLGNFDFQKMAMVKDLDEHLDLIAGSELIAAITGDAAARAAIAEAQSERVNGRDLDGIPAKEELFILDADSSQQSVLHTVLRNQSHGVIQGPPGTGKSQTIANLIAALIGNGKRVLFVAEKRAALDAVMKRLNRVGLGHLVLDLHGADVKRRKIYENLRFADQIARTTLPTDGEATFARFEELRRQLNEHSAAVNEKRSGCGLSFYELQARLAAIVPEAQSASTFPRATLRRLNLEEYNRLRDLLGQAASNPGLFLRDPETPWGCAELRDEPSANAAVELVNRICDSLADVRRRLTDFHRGTATSEVHSTTDLQDFNARLVAGRRLAGILLPSISSADVEGALRDMGPGQANFFTRLVAFFREDHRRGVRSLRTHSRSPVGARALYLACQELVAQPEGWRKELVLERLAGDESAVLGDAMARLIADMSTLKAIACTPEPESLVAYAAYAGELRRSRLSAHRVVQVRAIVSNLRSSGLDPVLQEITRNSRSAELWQQVLDSIWLRSHIEELLIEDERLATFDRRTHEVAVREFQELDKKRLTIAASQVKRRAAEHYFAAKREFGKEDVIFQTQLAKKIKQLPLRKLMSEAPRVTTSLCPCWMASPLSVSQLIDPHAAFDVVIFDEASQVLPEDAVTAIIRGKRTIVAGDRHQLPPTTFFSSGAADDGEEDEDDAAEGIESILDLMSIFVPPQSLEWHYRSKDERLIAFSNEHIYRNLITFPGIGQPPPAIEHVLVDAKPVDGEELSSSAEVRKVVELILDHAANRPHESLGVIAMGIKHSRRIDATLYEARKSRPELDDFFADRGDESFFCKNLERVQGDERDVILLSIGYGKDQTGKMYYRFGPLGSGGGERRLNVAITRARVRVITVSTFGSADMDDRRLNSLGPQLLKGYLRYAETSGRDLGRDGSRSETEPNPFELDIQAALEAQGLSILPQWGVSSYRIDLVVQDPDRPGSFVMAIECDGATYHSAETARDRDRIRQTHLEALGWRFHRIWSTDWFNDRTKEIDRVVGAYREALKRPASVPDASGANDLDLSGFADPPSAKRRGVRPTIWPGNPIEYYRRDHLRDIIRWITSDGLLRTDEELIREAVKELGYRRLGPKIEQHLRQAVEDARVPS